MNYKTFKELNDKIKISLELQGFSSWIHIDDYNKNTDMCLISSTGFDGWLSTSVIVSEIINKQNQYIKNPSRIKSWIGWGK